MTGQMQAAKSAPPSRLISFDEAGFTGPELLNAQQPYFVYASHVLTEDESAALVGKLRNTFGLQGNELKASKLKKRGSWPGIVDMLCEVTTARARFVTFDKRLALAGKFYAYFFEPILAANSLAFYRVDFHRYVTNAVYGFMANQDFNYEALTLQMQAFMRTFDPAEAPDIFGAKGDHPVEMGRILTFCQGYAAAIDRESAHLRPDASDSGKWTLDLTMTALSSLLLFDWGHRYPKIHVLCDVSKPLAARADFFAAFAGNNAAIPVNNGKEVQDIRANLDGPVEFGSSDERMSLQIADLLAGMSLDVLMRGDQAPAAARLWFERHRFREHSIIYEGNYDTPGTAVVRRGREILKELAARATRRADPLDGMGRFIALQVQRFPD